jgi:ribonuclease-3
MFDFILRPFRRNFGKDKIFYRAVDDMFGFIAHNIELYKLALIHKSASVVLENGQQINNERLEFLGDAVLESVTSDYLFIEFPDKNEGFLTQLRSKMVSRQSLNGVAKRIGLDEHVITGSSHNTSQKHIHGDAFEAMIGAIYLDQGYNFVNRLLINKVFVDYIKLDSLLESETDFKSRLIEWCQKNHHTITFDTQRDKDYQPSHPVFYTKVLIDGLEMGHGAGDSKKEAEQKAAFSVATFMSDEQCASMLDRMDRLERRQGGEEQRMAQ